MGASRRARGGQGNAAQFRIDRGTKEAAAGGHVGPGAVCAGKVRHRDFVRVEQLAVEVEGNTLAFAVVVRAHALLQIVAEDAPSQAVSDIEGLGWVGDVDVIRFEPCGMARWNSGMSMPSELKRKHRRRCRAIAGHPGDALRT